MILSTFPSGLLSRQRFRLQAQVESTATGYRDETEGSRFSQKGDKVRHIDSIVTIDLEGKEFQGYLTFRSEVGLHWLWEVELVVDACGLEATRTWRWDSAFKLDVSSLRHQSVVNDWVVC